MRHKPISVQFFCCCCWIGGNCFVNPFIFDINEKTHKNAFSVKEWIFFPFWKINNNLLYICVVYMCIFPFVKCVMECVRNIHRIFQLKYIQLLVYCLKWMLVTTKSLCKHIFFFLPSKAVLIYSNGMLRALANVVHWTKVHSLSVRCYSVDIFVWIEIFCVSVFVSPRVFFSRSLMNKFDF